MLIDSLEEVGVMEEKNLYTKAEEILLLLRRASVSLVLAESCTGGLLSAALTAVPGASEVFHAGLVTYSNAAKAAVLGVSESILETHGAVSAEAATSMARGARSLCDAAVALSVTGIAGPSGATPLKPLGLTYFGLSSYLPFSEIFSQWLPPYFLPLSKEKAHPLSKQTLCFKAIFPGPTRNDRCRQAVEGALTLLRDFLSS